MLNYNKISSVHLEISTRCNAACPECPRNFRGVDVIDSYPICDMSLEQAQKIFTIPFLKQINHVLINGNYDRLIKVKIIKKQESVCISNFKKIPKTTIV
jgi:hypothetical protein